jgi:hypothetical protein
VSWRSTHGEHFAVPAEVLDRVASGKLHDVSWGNDAAPRFVSPLTDEVTIWVGHPDDDKREIGSRYSVCEMTDEGLVEGEYHYEGADIAEALRVFDALVLKFTQEAR